MGVVSRQTILLQGGPTLLGWNRYYCGHSEVDHLGEVGHTFHSSSVLYLFFSITYPTGGGVAGGIGWSGQWNAAFSRTSDLALEVKAGMERTRFYLRPGEEVRTPSILLSFW